MKEVGKGKNLFFRLFKAHDAKALDFFFFPQRFQANQRNTESFLLFVTEGGHA